MSRFIFQVFEKIQSRTYWGRPRRGDSQGLLTAPY